MKIPKTHPRYESLRQREALVKGYKSGVVALAGLIAYGRGEAFDYMLGEKTQPFARRAVEATAAMLLLAKNPVISVNGNTAVLCPKELVKLSKMCNAKIEINLFYRTKERIKKIEKILKKCGALKVYGVTGTKEKEIKGISSERRRTDEEGIYMSDVVLVPLEDGDRTEALVKQGKKVIAVDLNPFSRTSKAASITLVDNVTRAVPELINMIKKSKEKDELELKRVLKSFDNQKNLKKAVDFINARLKVFLYDSRFQKI